VTDCAASSCAIPLSEFDSPEFCPTHWRMLPAEIKGPLQSEAGHNAALERALVRIADVELRQSRHVARLTF
jgi:hypothetical protein